MQCGNELNRKTCRALVIILLFAALLLPVHVFAEDGDAQPQGGRLLSSDGAFTAVYMLLDEHYDMDMVYEYHGWLVLEEKVGTVYTVMFRSYTSAHILYYVDEVTGDIYSRSENAGAWDEGRFFDFEGLSYEGNAYDYLLRDRIVVSMGDSYSSGEGLGDYGKAVSNREKLDDQDWLAHRSDYAWPGQLEIPGIGKLSDSRDTAWLFVAASGAKTGDFTEGQKKNYFQADEATLCLGDDFSLRFKSKYTGKIGSRILDPQLSVFQEILPIGQVSYVTMSIGGNDLGFADILIGTALTSSYLFPSALPDTLKAQWYRFEYASKDGPSVRDNIKQAYRDTAAAAGGEATLIVAGYPKLLDPNVNNGWFDSYEANLINSYAKKLDDALAELVEEYRDEEEGARIRYVSVFEAFKDHPAYSKEPYINGIVFTSELNGLIYHEMDDIIDSLPVSFASFHPNQAGTEAYRACVQAVIDECEAEYPSRKEEQPESRDEGDGSNSGGIDMETAFRVLTNYTDVYHSYSGGDPVMFYTLGRKGDEYCFRLRAYNGLYENYYVNVNTGEIFEECERANQRGSYEARRSIGNEAQYRFEDGGPEERFYDAVINYVTIYKYNPDHYPDITGYLWYNEAAYRYIGNLALTAENWREVILDPADGRIYEEYMNIFRYNGNASDYMSTEEEPEGDYSALLADALADSGRPYGDHYGICRYDIDGDGTTETLLYLHIGKFVSSLFIYDGEGSSISRIGVMPVSMSALNGVYIFRHGLITEYDESDGLEYYTIKNHRLVRVDNWEGSGIGTIEDCDLFYNMYSEEIELLHWFHKYALPEKYYPR